jgi:predicted nucleic-acid-binding protein
MIGLDTNILLRYQVQDDPGQSPAAAEIMERRLTEEKPGCISLVVMAEIVWVLERSYGFSKPLIANAVERVLQTEVLAVQNERDVFTAMLALRSGKGSFADALISALAARAGCNYTLTLDLKPLRLPGFKHA